MSTPAAPAPDRRTGIDTRRSDHVPPAVAAGQAALKPYAWMYRSGDFAGAARIVRRYLGLPEDFILPVAFPHGVDTQCDPSPVDLNAVEPIYLATTPERARQAEARKVVLQFPHPWLLLPPAPRALNSAGTLFVGTPSGPGNNHRLYEAIRRADLPKPWGMMLKFRGLDAADFRWWEERGLATHTAGDAGSEEFYPSQRKIVGRYATVALPYLSSIGVFAAEVGCRITLLPGVELEFVTAADNGPSILCDRKEIVAPIWRRLTDGDPAAAAAEARRQLGAAYLGREEMRDRLFEALGRIQDPLDLQELRPRLARPLARRLIARGLPAHKLLPSPFHALVRKLAFVTGLNRIGVVRGNELAHFGLAEGRRLSFSVHPAYRVGRGISQGEGPKTSVEP